MDLANFTEYKRREFCNDVKCQVQLELNKQQEKSEAYEKIRQTCSNACCYTTYQFHHWLIDNGYILLASSQLKKSEQTILVNLHKSLVKWLDEKAQEKSASRSSLIMKVLTDYKERE